jgi:CcmD family protein
MDNLTYLFAAYTAIWVGIIAYVFVLMLQEKKLRRDIESLKEELKEKTG